MTESNPLEEIENDKRLTAILTGLRGVWNYGDDFLSIVLWHTDDFDLANEVIQTYMDGDEEMLLEEAFFEHMTKREFEYNCLESDYLNYTKCKELYEKYDN